MARAAAAALLLAALYCGAPARAGERVALLIGNARYANAAFDLRNPVNDAAALAQALAGLGFATEVVVDADRAEAEAALADFAARAAEAEIALFFFAGHGVQVEGANHLLTAGFAALSEEEIARQSLSLDAVREALAAARPELGLIVLDACRNNPLSEGGVAARGLARAQGGSGLLVAYATDPGNVAYDGLEANSVFTAALIDHLATPGLEVRLMFGRVRQDVVMASSGLQVPWVEEAVLGEHFLDPRPTASAAPGVAEEVALWQAATREGSVQAYDRYLDRYPEGLFQVVAAERMARLDEPPASPGSAAIPAEVDRESLVAALATLGFLSTTREVAPDAGELDAAFAAYARQFGAAAGLNGLYLDAAQVAVMLGATTAQRIRTDMAALASIETAIGMAGRARVELAGLAEGNAEAAGALRRADADIAAMGGSRAAVLARLDQSRSYYSELVGRSSRHFRPYLARALPGILDRARAADASPGRVAEDAGRFVDHATAEGTIRTKGSYAWLADFLPSD